jgi:hypothetical protein
MIGYDLGGHCLSWLACPEDLICPTDLYYWRWKASFDLACPEGSGRGTRKGDSNSRHEKADEGLPDRDKMAVDLWEDDEIGSTPVLRSKSVSFQGPRHH